MPGHIFNHMPEYVLKYVSQHVLKHVSDKQMLVHMPWCVPGMCTNTE